MLSTVLPTGEVADKKVDWSFLQALNKRVVWSSQNLFSSRDRKMKNPLSSSSSFSSGSHPKNVLSWDIFLCPPVRGSKHLVALRRSPKYPQSLNRWTPSEPICCIKQSSWISPLCPWIGKVVVQTGTNLCVLVY